MMFADLNLRKTPGDMMVSDPVLQGAIHSSGVGDLLELAALSLSKASPEFRRLPWARTKYGYRSSRRRRCCRSSFLRTPRTIGSSSTAGEANDMDRVALDSSHSEDIEAVRMRLDEHSIKADSKSR
jgi:hypothetical protein